jgi:YfiH family protein
MTVAPNGVAYLAVPQWDGASDWLWRGFSTRKGGVSRSYLASSDGVDAPGEMNLGFTEADSRESVLENRSRFVEAVTGSRTTPLITLRQIHSNRSVVANNTLAELAAASVAGTTQAHEADGLITSQPGALIGIQTADCIPVLVADPTKCVVGAFHAGWRGTVRRIVELGVARMRVEFGSDPAEMIAAIGPGIGACCYTVGSEVRNEFGEQFTDAAELFATQSSDGREELRLDLIEANRRQLLDAGLSEKNITVVGECTACAPEWFYSHRASGGHAGRMMAVIGIR